MDHFILRYLLVALSMHIILGERITHVSASSRSSAALQAEVAESTTMFKTCNNLCVTCKNGKKWFVGRSKDDNKDTNIDLRKKGVVPLHTDEERAHECTNIWFAGFNPSYATWGLNRHLEFTYDDNHWSQRDDIGYQRLYASKCPRISKPVEVFEKKYIMGRKWLHDDVYECFKHVELCGDEGSENIEVLWPWQRENSCKGGRRDLGHARAAAADRAREAQLYRGPSSMLEQ